ncbi:MAG: hypothetical protein WAW23_01575 [Candidatus Methanoperedens sp.]
MGFAVIMFVALMVMSVVMITAVTYGVVKDSQIAPLKAENIYAEREAGKAQTGLTIVNTCLSGQYPYLGRQSAQFGPYTLYLTVRNNGSVVLNPKNSTIFYNLSYFPFDVTSGNVWTPLTNSSMQVPNIYIYNVEYIYPLRLMMTASNGVKTIAPTTPTNFSGQAIKANTTYTFSWNSATDDTRVAYYLLYGMTSLPSAVCPPTIDYITQIPGNYTATSMDYQVMCTPSCNTDYFYLTAVDTDGNMGVQSVTLKCIPGQNKDCEVVRD